MKNIDFIKMHGIGNDFVIIDMRAEKCDITPDMVRAIADRHKGVGCDQLVLLEEACKGDCFIRFFNADGSDAGACGNATRCVAYYIMQENGKDTAILESVSGILECKRAGDMQISVNMGKAKTGWEDIPLSHEVDSLNLPIKEGSLKNPVALSMGNPHAVFFVEDAAAIDLALLGPKLENHEIFPERANIGVAQVVSGNEILLRVWERGAGETKACGTGACAAVFAAYKRGLTGRDSLVKLSGGDLHIAINSNDEVIMTGAVAVSFKGQIAGVFFA